VGVLTMAGKGPRVLITPTNDLGKILQALHGMPTLGLILSISSLWLPCIWTCYSPKTLLNISLRNTIFVLLPGLEVGGEMSMASGVQVAQLALKHRQNKHQRQRIVLFAGR
jgi:26S proteasome regulatory subunit N10